MRLVPRIPSALLSASVYGSSSRIFESLGFETTNIVGSVSDVSLRPPDIDPHSPASRIARNKLLRGWVELSAWTADFSKRHGGLTVYAISMLCPSQRHAFTAPALRACASHHKIWVKLDSAREEYQHAIGAHPEQSVFTLIRLLSLTSFVQSLEGNSHKSSANTRKLTIP